MIARSERWLVIEDSFFQRFLPSFLFTKERVDERSDVRVSRLSKRG